MFPTTSSISSIAQTLCHCHYRHPCVPQRILATSLSSQRFPACPPAPRPLPPTVQTFYGLSAEPVPSLPKCTREYGVGARRSAPVLLSEPAHLHRGSLLQSVRALCWVAHRRLRREFRAVSIFHNHRRRLEFPDAFPRFPVVAQAATTQTHRRGGSECRPTPAQQARVCRSANQASCER